MRLLLAAGVNIEACDRNKQTALHLAARAARKGNDDVMRELILHNANMFPVNHISKTPFDMSWENEEHAKVFLIQIYSDRLSQEDEGRLALHSLLNDAKYSFALFVSRRGYSPWNSSQAHPPLHPLLVKIPLGNLKWKHMRTLLLSVDKEFFRKQDDSGRLPIHIACQTNAPVVVLAAIVKRDPATLYMADHAGALPLHEFCGGYCDTNIEFASGLQFLVERGGVGTLAARNRDGALPLHILCASTTSSPPLSAVRYLLHSFPDSVVTQTNDGLYPFMIAATNASLSLVYEIVRANPVLVVRRY